MSDAYDVRMSQLRGYLGEFYVRPSEDQRVWDLAGRCLGDRDTHTFGFTFRDEVEMRRFGLAVLLSQGRQLNWYAATSYGVLQDNLAGKMLLTDYADYDVVFIMHRRGTMKNAIMGQTANTVALLRQPKKTFYFDLGGPPVSDLAFPVVKFGVSETAGDSRI